MDARLPERRPAVDTERRLSTARHFECVRDVGHELVQGHAERPEPDVVYDQTPLRRLDQHRVPDQRLVPDVLAAGEQRGNVEPGRTCVGGQKL